MDLKTIYRINYTYFTDQSFSECKGAMMYRTTTNIKEKSVLDHIHNKIKGIKCVDIKEIIFADRVVEH